MQYIPCNSALLAQETLFQTQKGTFFAQKVRNSQQILICDKIAHVRAKNFRPSPNFSAGAPHAPAQLLPPCHQYHHHQPPHHHHTNNTLLLIENVKLWRDICVSPNQILFAARQMSEHLPHEINIQKILKLQIFNARSVKTCFVFGLAHPFSLLHQSFLQNLKKLDYI